MANIEADGAREYWTTAEVKKRFRLGSTAIEGLRVRGVLVGAKIGRDYRWTSASVERMARAIESGEELSAAA